MAPFRLIDDFDMQTRGGATCNIMGTIKRKTDPGVFRGPMIHREGYFDVSVDAIREAAAVIGMVPEHVHQRTLLALEHQGQAAAEAQMERDAVVARNNALVTELAAQEKRRADAEKFEQLGEAEMEAARAYIQELEDKLAGAELALKEAEADRDLFHDKADEFLAQRDAARQELHDLEESE